MKMLRFCRLLTAFFTCLLLVTLLSVVQVVAQDTEDSQLFLSGFNAYQQKDFPTAITRLGEVLQNFPETPLRDMTLFWLARSHYKAGQQQEAARYLAQFTREYPDNPLKNTVEEDLLTLSVQYEKNRGSAEQLAAVKKEADRLKAEQLEAERLAQQKLDSEKAGKARIAAQAVENQRMAQQNADLEAAHKARTLKAKAETDRIAREKVEADRRAAGTLEEQKRQAVLKTEQDRLANEKAAAEKLAAQKAADERRAAETTANAAAAKRDNELAAAQKAEASRAAAEKARQERLNLKEKAIAEYKGILDRFPGSPAAQTAAIRLKELGIAVALPIASSAATATADTVGTAQVLTLEVAQYAAFEFNLQSPASPIEVARKTFIPFEIQNRGNGQDSFYLVSSFPSEFGARFVAAIAPEQAINQTPLLASGERFRGLLQLNVPTAAIDGLRIAHPVKAASQFMGDASQSRVVSLVAAAPLLRAVVKTEKLQLLPGEQLQYRVAVLNVGSTPAQDVTLRLNFPAQYQPLSSAGDGFRKEMDAALVMDGITLKPGESRDFTVSFQLKPEALAKEELMVRADVINNALQTRGSFLSNATFVLPVSALVAKLGMDRVKVVPGQTVSIPARIINKGNQRERISLVATSAPFHNIGIYHDLNRDGLRQPGEPEVTAIGPLGPKEEAALLLEVVTPRNAQDGAVEKITLTAAPESAQGTMVTAEAQISYSRPMLQLTMKGREGRMVPGELLTVELDVLNRGSNLAKLVDLEISWPEQVELVAADQVAAKSQPGLSSWRFNELGAGEKRTIKASFRIRSGTVVGTGVQLKSLMTYQDHAGNRY